MELNPRQVAFILDAMSEIENSEDRRPTERKEAGRIRRTAEAALTE